MKFIFRRPALALLASLLLGLQLSGCSKDSNPQATGSAASSAPAQAAGAAPAKSRAAEEGLDQKLSIYIDCYNSLDERVHSTIARYASWVKDMNAGPTGKERVVYGLYQISPEQKITECRTKFGSAAGTSPSHPLDVAAKEYMDALSKLHGVVAEAYPYYDRKDYQDDHFAKAKELHPRLRDAMAAFKASSTKLSDAIEVENDKRLDAQMQQLEKEEGRKLPYLHMATMHEAKQLLRLITKDSFSVEEASAKLAAYEKIADEVQAAIKAAPQQGPSAFKLSRFTEATEGFRKAAKERVRRVRDQVPYSTGDRMLSNGGSDWMVEGSPGKVLKIYNELVERSNQM